MWITQFFLLWKQWLTDAKAYLEFTRLPLRTALAIVFLNLVFLSIPNLYELNVKLLPDIKSQAVEQLSQSPTYYPEDLVINWNQTQLSLNQTEPLTLPAPWGESEYLPPTLAIINPQIESPDQLDETSSSLALITSDKLWVSNMQGNWSDLNLNELPGFNSAFEIQQQNYGEYVSTWLSTLEQLTPYLHILGSGLVFVLFLIVNTVTFSIDGILIYLMVRIFGTKVSFKKVWLLSLQIGIVTTLIATVAGLIYKDLPFNLSSVGYWTVLTYIFLYKHFKKLTW